MTLSQKKKEGFSMIEMLAVLSVMAVIIYMVLPNAVRSRTLAEEKFVQAVGASLDMAKSSHYASLGQNATSWNSLSDADKYLQLAPYIDKADDDWSSFTSRYPGYTITLGVINEDTTIVRDSDSEPIYP